MTAAHDPNETIEASLRNYFVRDLGLKPPGDDDQLVKSGFAASAQLLELVNFVEERWGVLLKPIDVLPENLATISAIARTVRARLASP
jgi:acyl carrier protein